MPGPKEIWETAKLIAQAYGDMREIVGFLRKRLGDNWAKVLSDSAQAARLMEDPNATPEQIQEGARQFAGLFERVTQPK